MSFGVPFLKFYSCRLKEKRCNDNLNLRSVLQLGKDGWGCWGGCHSSESFLWVFYFPGYLSTGCRELC